MGAWKEDWPQFGFMVFKALVQWVFAEAFRINRALFVTLMPTIVFTGMMLVTALLVTWLAFWRPKGEQPSTYGELERMVELMDGYDGERFVWWEYGKVDGGRRVSL